jgi:hypothetical protein
MGRPKPRDVEKACYEALRAEGFDVPKRDLIRIALSDEFFGWVGLNEGVHPEFVRINPFIGVHAVKVQKLFSEVRGKKYTLGESPTIVVHLGEIAPKILEFLFENEGVMRAEAGRLATEIRSSGLKWMKENARYDAIIKILDGEKGSLGGKPEKLAIAKFVSGGRQVFDRHVAEELESYRASENNYLTDYESFVGDFTRRILE